MSSARPLGVVANPTADGGRAGKLVEQLFDEFRRRHVDVVDLSAPTMKQAQKRARDAVRDGEVAAIVVVGGDGMCHLGVNAVAATGVPLGIIAAGTGNDSAGYLGLPIRDVNASVAVIARAWEAHSERVIDAIHVTFEAAPGAAGQPGGADSDGSVQTWCLGAVSVGLDAAVNARADAMRWPHGPLRYRLAALRELALYKPYGFRVEIDGEAREYGGVLTTVANGPAIGGGILIAPQADMSDGLLDVVTAGVVSRREAVKLLREAYSGGHVLHPMVDVVRGTEVRVEACERLGLHPPTAYSDGEPIGELPLTCELVRGAVHVLT